MKQKICFIKGKMTIVEKEIITNGVIYNPISYILRFGYEHDFTLTEVNPCYENGEFEILDSSVRLSKDQTYTHFNPDFEFDFGDWTYDQLNEITQILKYAHNKILKEIDKELGE